MSSRSTSVSSSSSISSLHSASDSGAVEEGSDTEVSIAPEELVPPVATETVREVYLISDEDAREHEDAVELVNWSTFEEWKQPWHIVKLWEGSVYDEMTLWGSIPLQNDKLRKVLLGLFTFNGRLSLNRCVNFPNDFDNTGSGILMLFL
jgi:hypothetical protein